MVPDVGNVSVGAVAYGRLRIGDRHMLDQLGVRSEKSHLFTLEYRIEDGDDDRRRKNDQSYDDIPTVLLPECLWFIEEYRSFGASVRRNPVLDELGVIDDGKRLGGIGKGNFAHGYTRQHLRDGMHDGFLRQLWIGEVSSVDAVSQISAAQGEDRALGRRDHPGVTRDQHREPVHIGALVEPGGEQQPDRGILVVQILLHEIAVVFVAHEPFIPEIWVGLFHIPADPPIQVAVQVELVGHKHQFTHPGKHPHHHVDRLAVEVRHFDHRKVILSLQVGQRPQRIVRNLGGFAGQVKFPGSVHVDFGNQQHRNIAPFLHDAVPQGKGHIADQHQVIGLPVLETMKDAILHLAVHRHVADEHTVHVNNVGMHAVRPGDTHCDRGNQLLAPRSRLVIRIDD